ncbi:MAG: PAS domain S-box protein [Balneolaceae bacterium]
MKYNKGLDLSASESSLLNAFPGEVAIIDYDGIILSVNDAWAEDQNKNNHFCRGGVDENYFDYCRETIKTGSDYALKLFLGIRNLLDGERPHFEMTYPFYSGMKKSWYRVEVNPYKEQGAILLFEEITNSVTTMRALKDSEERYKQHFEHSLSGIIIGTPEGDIEDVNPAACQILGYTREELINGGRSMIMDSMNPVNQNAWEVREAKSKYEGEKKYIHKSGETITVHVSSVLYRNEDGGLNSINTFKDITKQKEIENKLVNEQKFIKASIESIPGTFYVIDKDMKLIRWNDAVETELGYTPEMINKMVVEDFIDEKDREKVSETIEQVLEEGEGSVVAGMKTVKKGVRQYRFNVKTFTADDETYLAGTGVDITNLLEAEKAREENLHKMEQLFENSPLGIVMINMDNTVKKANKSFKKMFGYDCEDFEENNIDDLIANGDQKAEAERISHDSFKGKPTQIEGVRFGKNGEKRSVFISSVPVKNNKDEIIAVYGIYVDITEQKELENRIKELLIREQEAREKVQSSLNEKEVLLQEVHHRVKNNLAVMAGLLDLQLMEEKEKDVIRKLSEVQSRIYSIAKIHETLYQEKNMVSIKYHEYMKSFIKSLPQFNTDSNGTTNFALDADEVQLNLNQAVPFGLMLNEMLNVLFTEEPNNVDSLISLNLKQQGDHISLQLQGESLDVLNLIKNRHSENFQFKLIEIFLDQLNAEIELDEKEQKVKVSFKKMSIRGSSSSFLIEEE